MIRMLIDLPSWVSCEDGDQRAPSARYRLKKHLFVFLAIYILVGASASGVVNAVEVHQTTSGGELEQEEESVFVGSSTEKSWNPSTVDRILIESSLSGFYSDTFDRICRQRTSRDLVTGPTGSRPAETMPEDRRHSMSANSSYLTPGGAGVRLRRSSARHSGGKAKGNAVLLQSECDKIDVGRATTADSQLQEAAINNLDEVDNVCNSNNQGCLPVPQVIHLADRHLCRDLPLDIRIHNLRTVIHACPDISCCVAGRRCQVKRSVTVNKTFMITDVKAVTIAFQNHTECSCGKPPREKKINNVRQVVSKKSHVTRTAALQGSTSTSIKGAV